MSRARALVLVILAIVAACERVVDLTPDAATTADASLTVQDAGSGDGGDGGGAPDALFDGALAD